MIIRIDTKYLEIIGDLLLIKIVLNILMGILILIKWELNLFQGRAKAMAEQWGQKSK